MELAQGSLYKAFKDKKSIFIATMERYRTLQTERFEAAVAGYDTGYERLRAGLMFYAERSHGATGSDGCLVVGAAADLAALDDDIAVVVERAVKARSGSLPGWWLRGRGTVQCSRRPIPMISPERCCA